MLRSRSPIVVVQLHTVWNMWNWRKRAWTKFRCQGPGRILSGPGLDKCKGSEISWIVKWIFSEIQIFASSITGTLIQLVNSLEIHFRIWNLSWFGGKNLFCAIPTLQKKKLQVFFGIVVIQINQKLHLSHCNSCMITETLPISRMEKTCIRTHLHKMTIQLLLTVPINFLLFVNYCHFNNLHTKIGFT